MSQRLLIKGTAVEILSSHSFRILDHSNSIHGEQATKIADYLVEEGFLDSSKRIKIQVLRLRPN